MAKGGLVDPAGGDLKTLLEGFSADIKKQLTSLESGVVLVQKEVTNLSKSIDNKFGALNRTFGSIHTNINRSFDRLRKENEMAKQKLSNTFSTSLKNVASTIERSNRSGFTSLNNRLDSMTDSIMKDMNIERVQSEDRIIDESERQTGILSTKLSAISEKISHVMSMLHTKIKDSSKNILGAFGNFLKGLPLIGPLLSGIGTLGKWLLGALMPFLALAVGGILQKLGINPATFAYFIKGVGGLIRLFKTIFTEAGLGKALKVILKVTANGFWHFIYTLPKIIIGGITKGLYKGTRAVLDFLWFDARKRKKTFDIIREEGKLQKQVIDRMRASMGGKVSSSTTIAQRSGAEGLSVRAGGTTFTQEALMDSKNKALFERTIKKGGAKFELTKNGITRNVHIAPDGSMIDELTGKKLGGTIQEHIKGLQQEAEESKIKKFAKSNISKRLTELNKSVFTKAGEALTSGTKGLLGEKAGGGLIKGVTKTGGAIADMVKSIPTIFESMGPIFKMIGSGGVGLVKTIFGAISGLTKFIVGPFMPILGKLPFIGAVFGIVMSLVDSVGVLFAGEKDPRRVGFDNKIMAFVSEFSKKILDNFVVGTFKAIGDLAFKGTDWLLGLMGVSEDSPARKMLKDLGGWFDNLMGATGGALGALVDLLMGREGADAKFGDAVTKLMKSLFGIDFGSGKVVDFFRNIIDFGKQSFEAIGKILSWVFDKGYSFYQWITAPGDGLMTTVTAYLKSTFVNFFKIIGGTFKFGGGLLQWLFGDESDKAEGKEKMESALGQMIKGLVSQVLNILLSGAEFTMRLISFIFPKMTQEDVTSMFSGIRKFIDYVFEGEGFWTRLKDSVLMALADSPVIGTILKSAGMEDKIEETKTWIGMQSKLDVSNPEDSISILKEGFKELGPKGVASRGEDIDKLLKKLMVEYGKGHNTFETKVYAKQLKEALGNPTENLFKESELKKGETIKIIEEGQVRSRGQNYKLTPSESYVKTNYYDDLTKDQQRIYDTLGLGNLSLLSSYSTEDLEREKKERLDKFQKGKGFIDVEDKRRVDDLYNVMYKKTKGGVKLDDIVKKDIGFVLDGIKQNQPFEFKNDKLYVGEKIVEDYAQYGEKASISIQDELKSKIASSNIPSLSSLVLLEKGLGEKEKINTDKTIIRSQHERYNKTQEKLKDIMSKAKNVGGTYYFDTPEDKRDYEEFMKSEDAKSLKSMPEEFKKWQEKEDAVAKELMIKNDVSSAIDKLKTTGFGTYDFENLHEYFNDNKLLGDNYNPDDPNTKTLLSNMSRVFNVDLPSLLNLIGLVRQYDQQQKIVGAYKGQEYADSIDNFKNIGSSTRKQDKGTIDYALWKHGYDYEDSNIKALKQTLTNEQKELDDLGPNGNPISIEEHKKNIEDLTTNIHKSTLENAMYDINKMNIQSLSEDEKRKAIEEILGSHTKQIINSIKENAEHPKEAAEHLIGMVSEFAQRAKESFDDVLNKIEEEDIIPEIIIGGQDLKSGIKGMSSGQQISF